MIAWLPVVDAAVALASRLGCVECAGATVMVADISGARTDGAGRVRLVAGDLATPEAYEPRFDAVMASGLRWINVGVAGVWRGLVIVCVEYRVSERAPRTADGAESRAVVNIVGPERRVADAGFDASIANAFG